MAAAEERAAEEERRRQRQRDRAAAEQAAPKAAPSRSPLGIEALGFAVAHSSSLNMPIDHGTVPQHLHAVNGRTAEPKRSSSARRTSSLKIRAPPLTSSRQAAD